jgi:hypothetical protein
MQMLVKCMSKAQYFRYEHVQLSVLLCLPRTVQRKCQHSCHSQVTALLCVRPPSLRVEIRLARGAARSVLRLLRLVCCTCTCTCVASNRMARTILISCSYRRCVQYRQVRSCHAMCTVQYFANYILKLYCTVVRLVSCNRNCY